MCKLVVAWSDLENNSHPDSQQILWNIIFYSRFFYPCPILTFFLFIISMKFCWLDSTCCCCKAHVYFVVVSRCPSRTSSVRPPSWPDPRVLLLCLGVSAGPAAWGRHLGQTAGTGRQGEWGPGQVESSSAFNQCCGDSLFSMEPESNWLVPKKDDKLTNT